MVSNPQFWKGSDESILVDSAAHRAEEAQASATFSWWQESQVAFLQGLSTSVRATSADQSVQAGWDTALSHGHTLGLPLKACPLLQRLRSGVWNVLPGEA